MANKFYISLPAAQTPRSGSNCRRSPLTPPTVTPPSLSAHNSCASRQEGACSPTKASTLLAKVASNPTSPRRTPAVSPVQSPGPRSPNHHPSNPGSRETEETHSLDYWSTYDSRHQDGYISFPDFEKYCQTQEAEQSREEPRQRQTARV